MTRLDWQATDKMRFFGRYYIANYDRAPGFDGKNLLLASGSGLGLDNRVQTVSVGNDYVLTPTLVSATRFGYTRSRILRAQSGEMPSWTQLGSNIWTAAEQDGLRFINLSVTNGFPGAGLPGDFSSQTY